MQAYLTMIPVLSAEESIQRAEEVAVATGSIPQRSIDAITRRWNDDANALSEVVQSGGTNLKEMTKEQREEWARQRGIRVLK